MALLVTLVPLAQAQNSDGGTTSNTVVSIVATDADASEIPIVPPWLDIPQRIDPAIFTVSRKGPTNGPLDVFYHVSGTAANGVDYARLPGVVTIPAGAESAPIMVEVLDDLLVEGDETVVVALEAPACIAIYPPPPGCYIVGTAGQAAAVIHDDDTVSKDQLPVVLLQEPGAGVVLAAPATVEILADTMDPDGYVGRVEFFEGGNKIGEDFKLFFIPPPPGQHISYGMIWSNVPAGRFVLTAKAYDDQDVWSISPPVTVTVVESNPPPVTNVLPVVSMTAPDPFASEGLAVWLSNNVVGVSTLGASTWWRTNIVGTNTATFKVSRQGATNNDLTVYYAVSGTASNGVDYDSLSGIVTIPAGARSATITVVPIDDTLVEHVETVVLELRPPPDAAFAAPPAYAIGRPNRAAAIIVDNDQPRPDSVRLPDRLFHLIQPGVNGQWHRLDVSTDLVNWTSILTNSVSDGAIQFVDPEAADLPVRFYRVVPEPNPPAE